MGYLVIERSDGGVSVRIGVDSSADMAAEVAHWESRPKSQRNGWTAVSSFYYDTDPRPDGRAERKAGTDFRNSWTKQGNQIGIDLVKAKTELGARLDRAKRRKARELNEREIAGEDVTAERSALQSIQPNIDAAQNINALRALWPPGLER